MTSIHTHTHTHVQTRKHAHTHTHTQTCRHTYSAFRGLRPPCPPTSPHLHWGPPTHLLLSSQPLGKSRRAVCQASCPGAIRRVCGSKMSCKALTSCLHGNLRQAKHTRRRVPCTSGNSGLTLSGLTIIRWEFMLGFHGQTGRCLSRRSFSAWHINALP